MMHEGAKELGLFKRLAVNPQAAQVSHLQFEDDNVLFCECDKAQILLLKYILTMFRACSGLKINFDKLWFVKSMGMRGCSLGN